MATMASAETNRPQTQLYQIQTLKLVFGVQFGLNGLKNQSAHTKKLYLKLEFQLNFSRSKKKPSKLWG